MKKFLAAFLALILMATLLGSGAVISMAADPTAKINGTSITMPTAANPYVWGTNTVDAGTAVATEGELGSGYTWYVEYVNGNYSLYLRNATLESIALTGNWTIYVGSDTVSSVGDGTAKVAIQSSDYGRLTMVIDGDLTATGGVYDGSETSAGIKSGYQCNITISGSGKLTAGGATTKFGISSGGTLYVSGSVEIIANGSLRGIDSTSDMTISGSGDLTATAGAAGANTTSAGIYSFKNMTINGSGKLTATGGTTTEIASRSAGIYAVDGLTISSSGEIIATGGATNMGGSPSAGICAIEKLTINGSGEIIATGGTTSGSASHSIGIWAVGNNISIEKAKVTAKGNTATGAGSGSFGIYGEYDVSFTNGASIRVLGGAESSGSMGIQVNTVTIDGCKAFFATGRRCAVYSGYSMTCNDDVVGSEDYNAVSGSVAAEAKQPTGDIVYYMYIGDVIARTVQSRVLEPEPERTGTHVVKEENVPGDNFSVGVRLPESNVAAEAVEENPNTGLRFFW